MRRWRVYTTSRRLALSAAPLPRIRCGAVEGRAWVETAGSALRASALTLRDGLELQTL